MEYILPIKTVKRILKSYVEGEVSGKACEYVRDLLDNILVDIAKESNQYLKEYNQRRQYQNLPIRKRLDVDMVKFSVSEYLNHLSSRYILPTDVYMGETGQDNSETVLSTKQMRT